MKPISKNIPKKFFLLLTLAVIIFPTPISAQQTQSQTFEAKVVRILEEKNNNDNWYQKFEVLNEKQNKLYTVENGLFEYVGNQKFKKGDKLLISQEVDIEGNMHLSVADVIRKDALLLLFAIFVISAIVISGIHGVKSLFSMGLTFVVIYFAMLPLLLRGVNPMLVALGSAIVFIPITYYLSHGISQKTHIAIISTLITLLVVGLMATLFIELTHLTGYAQEEAGFLKSELGETINIKALVLAGIIISVIGILDDVTISQTSMVKELKDANNSLNFIELFTRAMRVGRDHIASLINTLILVYTGASLPLLLLFANNSRSFLEVVNLEMIADEIVKTLIGSIGLIWAVPITTLIAAASYAKLEEKTANPKKTNKH